MILQGRAAWIFPDNFDFDFIVGVKNISTLDLEILKQDVMKDFEPDFAQKIRPGDILIGGRNFGYGHHHPQSMRGLRALGINTVIAESMFHPLYRGELASGSHFFTCPGITKEVSRWDELYLNTDDSILINQTTGRTLALEPVGSYPLYLMEHGLLDFIQAIKDGTLS